MTQGAALPKSLDLIAETYNSLWNQSLPNGWTLQWIVQEDGGGSALGTMLIELTSGTAMLDYEANGGSWGAATTRNIALRRACGAWIMALDSDDVLADGALSALIRALVGEPAAAWACGRTIYLRDDGSTDAYPDRMPSGTVQRGWLADDWLEHGRPAATPGAFLYRRDVWLAYGGGMALRGSEDTGTLVAMSDDWEGRCVDQVVLKYRKWSGSTTSSIAWRADHARHQEVIAK